MPLGLLDLSIITDHLIKVLRDAIDATALFAEEPEPPVGAPQGVNPGTRFNIRVTGDPPDTLREQAGCQLSMYLFNITQDMFQRNAPVTGPRMPSIPAQPLSLDLYYLLTAFSSGSYIQEQQAMSIALKAFHEQPIVRPTTAVDGRKEEFCLTMEVENADELGRLWQAITTSLRLSVIYKVTVVFIEPPAPPRSQRVLRYNLLADSLTMQLLGTRTTVSFIGPDNRPVEAALSPAIVAPGQSFEVRGAGLGRSNSSDHVYLLAAGGDPIRDEIDVTGWTDPARSTDTLFTLNVPVAASPPAPGPPPAGVYQLFVGNSSARGAPLPIPDGKGVKAGMPSFRRSGGTLLSVAASVDPTGGPLLTAANGNFTLNGQGFLAGNSEVLLDSMPLSENRNGAGAGQFSVNGQGTAITFQLPAGLPAGRYAVRILVNQVESAPAKWVDAP